MKRIGYVAATGPEQKSVSILVLGPTATIGPAVNTVPNQNLSTGYLACNLVQDGNTRVTRDGDTIKGVHLGIRFNVVAGASAETSDAQLRWMVVLVRSPLSATQPLSTILEDWDEVGGTTTSFNSGVSPVNKDRVMILAQNSVVVSKVSGPTPIVPVSISLPLHGLLTKFNETANPMDYTNLVANGLFFICYSRMTGAGTLPTINNFLARYTFTEK